MDTTEKMIYVSPDLEVYSVGQKRVVCDSGSTSNYWYEDKDDGSWFN